MMKDGRYVVNQQMECCEQNGQNEDHERFKEESTVDRKEDESKLEAEVKELQKLLSAEMDR